MNRSDLGPKIFVRHWWENIFGPLFICNAIQITQKMELSFEEFTNYTTDTIVPGMIEAAIDWLHRDNEKVIIKI